MLANNFLTIEQIQSNSFAAQGSEVGYDQNVLRGRRGMSMAYSVLGMISVWLSKKPVGRRSNMLNVFRRRKISARELHAVTFLLDRMA